jgi:hypothetical protein
MKKIMLTSIMLVSVLMGSSQPIQAWNVEQQGIINIIQAAYVEGLQNLGDLDPAREGFHPDFEMLLFRDGKMSKMGIAPWIERVEQRKQNQQVVDPEIRAEFLDVEITGNVAVVKLDLFRGDNLLFTDYFSLYKFPDGWKIVSKVYHQHY